jgi:flagellar motor switch/type III secretory pathway protein FliN
VDARLFIGQSKVRLEDLQVLEVGDMLILEQSHTRSLSLMHPDDPSHLFPFTAHILTPHAIEVPYTQDIAAMEKQQSSALRQNLWDNLLINVSAEFFPSRLPLNQLKQMSEGQVVEIADLIHNKIRVHVEGKTVAIGELVIVGDKFGVRVTQLDNLEASDTHYPTEQKASSAAAAGTMPPPTQPMPQQAPPPPMPGVGAEPDYYASNNLPYPEEFPDYDKSTDDVFNDDWEP